MLKTEQANRLWAEAVELSQRVLAQAQRGDMTPVPMEIAGAIAERVVKVAEWQVTHSGGDESEGPL